MALVRQRPDIELPLLPEPPAFQCGSWADSAHANIAASPQLSVGRAPTRLSAVEVDLTRAPGIDNPGPWLDDVLGLLAHTVANSLREAAPSITTRASSQPIDILLSLPDGWTHLITDADRLVLSEMRGAIAGHHDCPTAGTGVVEPRLRPAAICVAVTCSGAAGLLYLAEPLTENVAIAFDLGCPVRRPVSRLDDTGHERLAFRTISMVTVQSSPLMPAAQVMAVLDSVRHALERGEPQANRDPRHAEASRQG